MANNNNFCTGFLKMLLTKVTEYELCSMSERHSLSARPHLSFYIIFIKINCSNDSGIIVFMHVCDKQMSRSLCLNGIAPVTRTSKGKSILLIQEMSTVYVEQNMNINLVYYCYWNKGWCHAKYVSCVISVKVNLLFSPLNHILPTRQSHFTSRSEQTFNLNPELWQL